MWSESCGHNLVLLQLILYKNSQVYPSMRRWGSCLKTSQHSIVVIIYLLLPINYIFFDSVSKILFKFFMYKSRRINISD